MRDCLWVNFKNVRLSGVGGDAVKILYFKRGPLVHGISHIVESPDLSGMCTVGAMI